jgi:hypothetical protein
LHRVIWRWKPSAPLTFDAADREIARCKRSCDRPIARSPDHPMPLMQPHHPMSGF